MTVDIEYIIDGKFYMILNYPEYKIFKYKIKKDSILKDFLFDDVNSYYYFDDGVFSQHNKFYHFNITIPSIQVSKMFLSVVMYNDKTNKKSLSFKQKYYYIQESLKFLYSFMEILEKDSKENEKIFFKINNFGEEWKIQPKIKLRKKKIEKIFYNGDI